MFWQVFASLLNWLCGRNLFCWYALQGRFIRLETIELISWLVLWLKLTLRLELIFMDGKIAKFKEFHAVRLAPVALLFDGIFIYTVFFYHWIQSKSLIACRAKLIRIFKNNIPEIIFMKEGKFGYQQMPKSHQPPSSK